MPGNELKVSRILWAAILGATLLFLVVLVVVGQTEPAAASGLPMPMLSAIALVAAMDAVLSVLLPRQLLVRGLRQLELATCERPASERLFADQPRRPRVFSDPATARRGAVAVFRTTHILGMALAEAVCLFGFVLKYLGASWAVALPFFFVTWLLMAVKFPRARSLELELERVYGADLA